ncbi:MAG: hypothetical protein WBN37_03470, partial [Arenicellales bacterium]
MTVINLSFVISPLIYIPVQARREAQDEPGTSGCAVRAVASSHPAGSFEHRRAPAGRACRYLFFWLLFYGEAKKSNSPIKGEKRVLIQPKMNKYPCLGRAKNSTMCEHKQKYPSIKHK